MNLEAIYHKLCLSGTPAADLDRMGDDTIAAMVRHLAQAGVTGGIPGIMTGLVEQEAAKRFALDKLGREGAAGEGSI
jgi:hypothetical protein